MKRWLDAQGPRLRRSGAVLTCFAIPSIDLCDRSRDQRSIHPLQAFRFAQRPPR